MRKRALAQRGTCLAYTSENHCIRSLSAQIQVKRSWDHGLSIVDKMRPVYPRTPIFSQDCPVCNASGFGSSCARFAWHLASHIPIDDKDDGRVLVFDVVDQPKTTAPTKARDNGEGNTVASQDTLAAKQARTWLSTLERACTEEAWREGQQELLVMTDSGPAPKETSRSTVSFCSVCFKIKQTTRQSLGQPRPRVTAKATHTQTESTNDNAGNDVPRHAHRRTWAEPAKLRNARGWTNTEGTRKPVWCTARADTSGGTQRTTTAREGWHLVFTDDQQ